MIRYIATKYKPISGNHERLATMITSNSLIKHDSDLVKIIIWNSEPTNNYVRVFSFIF